MAIIVDLLLWIFSHLALKAIDKNAIKSEKKRTGIDEENFIILDVSTHGNLDDLSPEDSYGNNEDGGCEW